MLLLVKSNIFIGLFSVKQMGFQNTAPTSKRQRLYILVKTNLYSRINVFRILVHF